MPSPFTSPASATDQPKLSSAASARSSVCASASACLTCAAAGEVASANATSADPASAPKARPARFRALISLLFEPVPVAEHVERVAQENDERQGIERGTPQRRGRRAEHPANRSVGRLRGSLGGHDAVVLLRVEVVRLLVIGSVLALPPVTLLHRVV